MYGNEQGVDGRGMFLNRFIKSPDQLFFTLVVIAIFLIGVTSTNQSVFLFLNQISLYTGADVWLNVTHLGNAVVIFAFSSWLIIFKPKWFGTILLGTILTSLIIQQIKFGLEVRRPPSLLESGAFILLQEELNNFSFPSGHTASAFVLASIFYYQIGFKYKSSILLLAVIIGLSRIVVGLHWPIDVLSGALLGWFIGLVAVYLNKKMNVGVQRWHQWIMLLMPCLALYMLIYTNAVSIEQVPLLHPVSIVSCVLVILVFIYRQVHLFLDSKKTS
jgi:membrane-associated phospholipid phosphatase